MDIWIYGYMDAFATSAIRLDSLLSKRPDISGQKFGIRPNLQYPAKRKQPDIRFLATLDIQLIDQPDILFLATLDIQLLDQPDIQSEIRIIFSKKQQFSWIVFKKGRIIVVTNVKQTNSKFKNNLYVLKKRKCTKQQTLCPPLVTGNCNAITS